jgi:hypothetical protein
MKFSSFFPAAFASVALAACGGNPDAKASDVGDTSKTAAKTASTAGGEVSANKDTAQTAAGGTSRSDTSTGKLIPGRSKMDATSFGSAIRAGNKALATWPKGPTPAAGAILPGKRIVAYYGNPHSKKMGVLGEYPEQTMLSMLDKEVAKWTAADPSTPVIPAIHLVTVVAQGAPGPDGMWRRREHDKMIEQAYAWAKAKKGLFFVDIQAGHSTLQQELPLLLKYLERPDVHLGVDPEFYMHYKREGIRPSAKVGQMMASDVNYAIQVLDKLVADKNLPPKVLVVHRFRRDMVPDPENIKPTSRVQVVMDMDGWGPPWLKFDSYRDYEVVAPVQFTGFKIFYHNDTRKNDALLTPLEVLALRPKPLYIQYQ